MYAVLLFTQDTNIMIISNPALLKCARCCSTFSKIYDAWEGYAGVHQTDER